MSDIQFLFDNQLISELENLIKNAKNRLLLISPFIDLDRRIQDALNEKKSKHDFELFVLFGKNEDNIYKSIKKDSLDFFKQFPNVEIRYNDRLHAKFYQNDYHFIMTSLNLYDYSLAKNIEVGIISKYAMKGIIGKVIDGSGALLTQATERVNQNVFGMDKDIDPIEKFQSIFQNSELKYKTEPIIVEKGGIIGILGGKKLDGFNVVVDNFSLIQKETKTSRVEVPKAESQVSTSNYAPSNKSAKLISTKQLAKSIGVSPSAITELLEASGFINSDKITSLGLEKGLQMKNYMGNDYIAFPENLVELEVLKK